MPVLPRGAGVLGSSRGGKIMRNPSLITLMLTIAGIVMSSAGVHAQTVITGQVTDAAGVGLPGVMVAAASATRGGDGHQTPVATTTGGDGRYDVIGLPSDVYTLTFSMPGFTRARRHEIAVEPNCRVPLDVQLGATIIADGLIVAGVPRHAVPSGRAMDHTRRTVHDPPQRPTGPAPTPRWLSKSVEDSCWGFRPMWLNNLDRLLTRHGCQVAAIQPRRQDLPPSSLGHNH